jgi:hypothetical protein
MKPKPRSKPEAKLTRQEMDAEIAALARRTITLLTEGSRQSIINGAPDVEVEQVVGNTWKHMRQKAVTNELLYRALIAEVGEVLWQDTFR